MKTAIETNTIETPVAFQQYDHRAISQEFLHLQELISVRPPAPDVRDWLVSREIRKDLFGDIGFSYIKWKKEMGRPYVKRLASAFVVEHAVWTTKFPFLLPLPAPYVYDLPEDDTYYWVAIYLESVRPGTNRLTVSLATGVEWPDPIRLRNLLITPGNVEFSRGRYITVAPTFELKYWDLLSPGQ